MFWGKRRGTAKGGIGGLSKLWVDDSEPNCWPNNDKVKSTRQLKASGIVPAVIVDALSRCTKTKMDATNPPQGEKWGLWVGQKFWDIDSQT